VRQDKYCNKNVNVGEELVGDYLQYVEGCEFVQKNLYMEDVQGEIDVIGIDLKNKKVYLCEVAIHLSTGLQYGNGTKPNNVKKLYDKFSKDIEYARKYFPKQDDYSHCFMLWSPIVKAKVKNNQLNDVNEVKQEIKKKYDEEIELVINESFLRKLNQLKEYAAKETKDIKSAAVRLYQIEARTSEYVKKHPNK
jgi:Holliday junction resolvase-like predicted endonuclease